MNQLVPDGQPARLLVSMEQAAAMLDLSHKTFKELAYAGVVPTVRIGTRRLVRVSDLEAYVASLAAAALP